MKTFNWRRSCLTMFVAALSMVCVMAVSASPYAYPQHPGYAYGTPPGYAAPAYRMPYRSAQMQQTEAYTRTASAPEQTEYNTTDAAIVTIDQMRFEPSIVTVKVGDKVTWKQSGRMPHTVTANDRSFGSQQLLLNAEFSQTFVSPGIHTYYCSLHPSMQGVVKVVE